jgi:hypothetical protein
VARRALLHPERHDTERLERRRHPGNGRHRALDADVSSCARAAANANAAAAPRHPVVGGAAGDGVIEVRGVRTAPSSGPNPSSSSHAVQDVDDTRAAARRIS